MNCRSFVTGLLGLVIALASTLTHARAQQVVHHTSVSLTSTDFDVAASTPKFDTALGTLTSVGVTFEIQATVAGGIENAENAPVLAQLFLGVEGEVTAADYTVFCAATSGMTTSAYSLSAFDGTIDYAGTSGASVATTVLSGTSGSGSLGGSGILAQYSGPPGAPGTAGTRVRATNVSHPPSGGDFRVTSTTSAAILDVTITYTYVPRVTSLCFGDGSGTACPCSNDSSAQTGCLNSFGYGSLLSATGGAAVSADSLVLTATVPGSNTTMFFQGTSPHSSGAGAVFGDGLRCLDGTVIRLVTTTGDSGVATFPTSRDPSISYAGSVPSGETRYYQVWYRNSAEFCTEDTFNLSNALRVDWGT